MSSDRDVAPSIQAPARPERIPTIAETRASKDPARARLKLGALAGFHYDSNVDLAPDVARFPFTPGGTGGKTIQLGLESASQAQSSWVALSGLTARYSLQKTDWQSQSFFGQILVRSIEAMGEERLLAGGGYTLWRGLSADSALRFTGSIHYREFSGDAVTMGQAFITFRHRLALGSFDVKAKFASHSFKNYTAADGEQYRLGADWNVALGEALSLHLGGSAARYEAHAATSTYREFGLQAGLNYRLHSEWTLFGDWRVARRDYDAVNPALARERSEDMFTGQIGLRQRILRAKRAPLLLTHSIRFLDIQSSNPAFERERQVIGSELRLLF